MEIKAQSYVPDDRETRRGRRLLLRGFRCRCFAGPTRRCCLNASEVCTVMTLDAIIIPIDGNAGNVHLASWSEVLKVQTTAPVSTM